MESKTWVSIQATIPQPPEHFLHAVGYLALLQADQSQDDGLTMKQIP